MSQISEDLIIRFVNNGCTDAELNEVRNWLEESDDNATLLFDIERSAVRASTLGDSQSARRHIHNKLERRIDAWESGERRMRIHRLWRGIAGAAAIVVVALIAGVSMWMSQEPRMLRIAADEKCVSFVLPDGSVVFLNKHSQLTYPERFDSDCRQVQLEGEGYFQVERDETRPFRVAGRHMGVEVLGTQFNFDSSDSTSSSVSLVDGSVEVFTSNQNEGVVLIPGQKALYSPSSGHLTVEDTNAVIDAAWHSGMITFENSNMTEIAKILRQLYDMDIELAPDIDSGRTYTGVTIYHSCIDSTLTQLAFTLPIKFVKENNKVVIYPK